jgi:hypothetical protein
LTIRRIYGRIEEWCLKNTAPERMLKVKDNSKSALRTRQIIISTIVLILLFSNIQLLISTKENYLNVEEEIAIIQDDEQEELEEVLIAQNYERNVDTTSRSTVTRTEYVEEVVEEITYKSIDEITISKDMDLTVRCGISKEDFKKLMKNLKTDTSGFFYDNSELIYDLCEKYEINEIFFCGLIAAESGWNIAPNHRNKCNYISMMSKGNLIKYSSAEEGLEAAAKLLHNKYLTPGGSYYNGKTLASVQKIFCPNSSTWVGLVYGCMKQIV